MDKSSTNLSFLRSTFDCAHAIEAARKVTSTTKVLWYVTPNSAVLRKLILEKSGSDKVVTQTEHFEHDDCQHKNESCEEQALATSVIIASGQLWSMAMTDFQIFTRDSGFGRVGAMLQENTELVENMTMTHLSLRHQ
eukprot:1136-Heterococcus_DN1.PRE.4